MWGLIFTFFCWMVLIPDQQIYFTSAASASSSTIPNEIPIYWINLDQNLDRRVSMQKHLEAVGVPYHKRIPALTPETCHLLLVESPCFRVSLTDIAILCSHLQALYTALHDPHPDAKDNPYFLVLEDDVRFHYRIRYQDLLRQVPAIDGRPFSSIQLMMSHKVQIEEAWNDYVSSVTTSTSGSPKYLAVRPRNSTVWSAQAILYRKEGIRPFIEKAVVVNPTTRTRGGRRNQEEKPKEKETLGFKLVNSFDYVKQSPYKINPFKPSIASDCLFADSFLYAMAQPSFLLQIPVMTSALTGRNSSLHQNHVAYHAQGFALIDAIHGLLDAKAEHAHHLFPEAILERDVVELNKKESNLNWTTIAMANPVSGKGIPKNFNFQPLSPV